jgi:hypothetical protein
VVAVGPLNSPGVTATTLDSQARSFAFDGPTGNLLELRPVRSRPVIFP